MLLCSANSAVETLWNFPPKPCKSFPLFPNRTQSIKLRPGFKETLLLELPSRWGDPTDGNESAMLLLLIAGPPRDVNPTLEIGQPSLTRKSIKYSWNIHKISAKSCLPMKKTPELYYKAICIVYFIKYRPFCWISILSWTPRAIRDWMTFTNELNYILHLYTSLACIFLNDIAIIHRFKCLALLLHTLKRQQVFNFAHKCR